MKPLRGETIEDHFPKWFEFGRAIEGSDVGVTSHSDCGGTGFDPVLVRKESASVLINEHNRCIDALVRAIQRLHEMGDRDTVDRLLGYK